MSRSENRVRPEFTGIRWHADELEQVRDIADSLDCTVPELIRAVMLGRAPARRAKCSHKHPGCSAQHFDMVMGYRLQRYQEELDLEAATGLGRGELEYWRENGGRLTTFGDWLRAHALSPDQQRERESHEQQEAS